MAWPPNLNVVDGLIACFGKSYEQAYGRPCVKPILVVDDTGAEVERRP